MEKKINDERELYEMNGDNDNIMQNRDEIQVLLPNDDNSNDGKKEQNKVEPLKWDLIFTLYFALIASTSCTFGGSYNFEYSRAIIFMGYLHFSTETSLSWHLIYSRKTAKILSIITYIIYGLQSISALFVNFDLIQLIFSTEFIMSDVLSFLSSLSMIFNNAMIYESESGTKFKYGAFAVLLHFTGVSLKLYMLPTEWFISHVVPQTGLYWVCIVLALPLQIYMSRPIILGKCNNLGEVQYNENQKYLKIFAQIINPLLSLLILPAGAYILSQQKTTTIPEGHNVDAFAYASGTFDDIILHLFWPYGFVMFFYVIYLYNVVNKGNKQISGAKSQ